MIFKVGDKVLFKKEKQQGVVLKIISKEVLLIRSLDDFKLKVSPNDVILFESSTNTPLAYGSKFIQKDERSVLKNIKKDGKKVEYKIDLHVEKIIKDYQNLDNFEIVQLQLSECTRKINDLIGKNIHKLIIVHGIGSGLLRSEVHNILDDYKLRYYLSRDGGATEVIF
jgi:dsDNA-specific endonuclease/ATPase MutS2